MKIIKDFKLANALLATALAFALSGCADDPISDSDDLIVTPDPGDTTTNNITIFADTTNSSWETFDCCAGTEVLTVVESTGDHGAVTEFMIGDYADTVLGFKTSSPLDISSMSDTGTLDLDVKIVTAPTSEVSVSSTSTTQWFVKLESNGGSDADGATGENAEIEIEDLEIGEWKSFSFELSDLENMGLDLSSIDNVMIFPQWGEGSGAVYCVDNVVFNENADGADTKAPVITLVGAASIYLINGVDTEYIDSGATVTDNVDTDLVITVGGDTVDTSVDGTYTITYDASDTAGNAADQVTRTVTVGPEVDVVYAMDFEGEQLTWTTFENSDNPALEFVDNPDTTGINSSATVAKFSAREAGMLWAGISTQEYTPFTWDVTNCIVKIMVLKESISPFGIKLATDSGWSSGEILTSNTLINEWEELTFDFSDKIGETADLYTDMAIFPDFVTDDRLEDTVIYFDNLSFSANGEDPAEPVEAVEPIEYLAAIDFEDDEQLTWTTFENGANADPEFVENIDTTGINTSNTVATMTAVVGGMRWAGVQTAEYTPFYWSENNSVVTMMVYKDVISPILLKFEDTTDTYGTEVYVTNTKVNEWEELTFDFSAQVGATLADGSEVVLDNLAIFPDFTDDERTVDALFYFDNITFTETDASPVDTVLEDIDFEGEQLTWETFENGGNADPEFVDNIDTTGINTSATVAKTIALAEGALWAGVQTFEYTQFSWDATNSVVRMMVYKDTISPVGIKFATATGWSAGEIKVSNTKINEWEELTFDFSDAIGVTDDTDGVAVFTNLAVFPDFTDEERTTDNVVYFDNITFSAE